MIVAIGIDVDPTFPEFVAAALDRDVPMEALNLRAAVEGEWRVVLPPGEPACFSFGGRSVELDPKDAYFCRIIDLSSTQADLAVAHRWVALVRAVTGWLEQVPGRVVNRPRVGWHNGAKPLHESILAELGFDVPDSFSSSDRDELLRFVRAGPTISKALSGVRADTEVATEALLSDFELTSGPVHLQRRIEGDDARIHVVGHELLAQRVRGADVVDYRRDADFDDLEVFEPPLEVRDAVVRATAQLGLAFAGWDFRVDAEGRYWCLEVNSMPGYAPYDSRCDGQISQLLLDYLSEEQV
jgi:hypothetical protein